jgi:hypothetical protein
MPAQIQITSFTGTLPAQVFVSDVYGNNTTLITTLTSAVPPVLIFTLPSLFDFAPAVMIKIIDDNGCEEISIEECISFFPSATPTPTPSITPSNTQTQTPTPSITPSPTQTTTPNASSSPTPSPTPTISFTPTQTQTKTPTVTPTASPTPTITYSPTQTPTPTQSSDPYPYFLAGYCYDGRMYAVGGSPSSNCTQVQSGLGSATRYKSNYPYSYLYSGLWSTVNMFIYDTVTASLLNSNPIADGCQYWETSSLGKVIAGYPQVGFDCTTPGGCCPGTPPT